MSSWRTAAVALLSFSSGLPLGLVSLSIPDWMRDIGVDIRVVGLFTLAQAPWAFKVVWSPLMDRYVPPFWGRRRGWMAVTQVALAVLGLLLAGVGQEPDAIWVVGALVLAIALASASQDIAIDAYAVEVLRKEEQGAAVGARIALYRAAMVVSGGAAITAAARIGWPAVNALLALVYVPMLLLTWKAPEPELAAPVPKTLREAVWHPFLGFLTRHRALEMLTFVVLYKFADNLAQALTRPFLITALHYNFHHTDIEDHNGSSEEGDAGPPTGIGGPASAPGLRIAQPVPNPFSVSARVAFHVPEQGAVSLVVYDVQGRSVKTLARGSHPAGDYEATWDGKDERGRRVASGVYFLRLEQGGALVSRKIVLTR
jgi:MFS family permease